MLRTILVSAVMLSGLFAGAAENDPRYAIESVEMNEIVESNLPLAPFALADGDCSKTLALQNDLAPLETTGVPIADIINIGAKIWEIVKENQPVANVTTPPMANALPGGSTCWADLEYWSAPQTKSYEIVYKNGFRMEVVKLKVRLQYTYGGRNTDGMGRYLANVSVVPADLNVLWGYTFNAIVEVGRPVNLKSAKDPMAGLELTVRWDVNTVAQANKGSMSLFVQGDGVSTKTQ